MAETLATTNGTMANGAAAASGPNRHPSLSASPKILRDLRRARRMTQLELAVAAGVSERTVRSAETGAQVRIDSLEQIAEALDAVLSDVVSDGNQLITARIGNQQIDRILSALKRYAYQMDVGGFAETLARDAQIEIVGDGMIPFTGAYRGIGGVERLRDTAMTTLDFMAPTEINDVRAGGDFVILRGFDHLRCRANRREDRLSWQHVYEFRHGRVVRIVETFDTLRAYRLFCESNAERAARIGSINGSVD